MSYMSYPHSSRAARFAATAHGAAAPGLVPSSAAVFANTAATVRRTPVCLALDRVCTADGALVNVSLRLRAGEIVGVAGAPGDGQRALAQVCLGQRAISQGTVRAERHVRASPDGASLDLAQCLRTVHIVDETASVMSAAARIAFREKLCELAAGGAAVLLFSADLRALIALSHRLPIMRGGRLVAEFEPHEYHEATLLEYCLD